MLTVVAIIIIAFSYTSTDKAIRALSDREMHHAHETILNKINDVLSVSQVIAQITKEMVAFQKILLATRMRCITSMRCSAIG